MSYCRMCIGEDGARYKTQALEPDLAMELVKMHVQHDHAGPVHAGDGQQQVRSEKIQRPKLVIKEGFTTEEAFNYFEHAWGEYNYCSVWGRRCRRWSTTGMERQVT